MEYVTENGDTVEARGLTLKVELGEKTKNEIVSQAMARMQEAMETIERLTQALAEADAENAKLKQLVRKMWRCYGYRSNDGDCSGCYYYNNGCEPMWDACRWECEMHKLGIEVE